MAKEASMKDKDLTKLKDNHSISEQGTPNLSYVVWMHLATVYEKNNMATEALEIYSLLIKQKRFSSVYKLRVNMGNLFFRKGKYLQAIKMYRMALDQISRKHCKLRQKVYSNIGNSFMKIGRLKDAIKNYESALSSGSYLKTEFNLLLCFIQVGDVEKSKHLMIMIASHPSNIFLPGDEESKANMVMGSSLSDSNFDRCTIEEHERKKTIDLLTFNAARLVASMKWGQAWDTGYIWVREQLKRKSHF